MLPIIKRGIYLWGERRETTAISMAIITAPIILSVAMVTIAGFATDVISAVYGLTAKNNSVLF